MSGFSLRKMFGLEPRPSTEAQELSDARGDFTSAILRKHLDHALEKQDRAADGLRQASSAIRDAVNAALAEVEQRGRRQ